MTEKNSVIISEGFVEFPSLSPYVAVNGPIFARSVSDKKFELGFVVQKKNTNLNQLCHGAVIFGLLDSVMGATVLYEVSPEYSVTTTNFFSNFLLSGKIGELLVGSAKIDGSSKSNIFVSGILSGPHGVVATASGTYAKILNKSTNFDFRKIVDSILKRE